MPSGQHTITRQTGTVLELLLSLIGVGLILYAIVMVIAERDWSWLGVCLLGLIVVALRAVLSVALDIREHLERREEVEVGGNEDDQAAMP